MKKRAHKARLKEIYVLPITPSLRRLQDDVYQEVLSFARTLTGRPKLQGLTDCPDLEALCDAYFLIRAGAIECSYTDCLLDGGNEGIVLRIL